MASKIAAFSILLIVIVTLSLLAVCVNVVGAQSISSPLPRKSVVNSVPEFYAHGQSNAFTLDISANGGTFSSGSSSMALVPWGYVTAQWTIGTVYIIFLANVTGTDFHIGYLYLSNSSSQFALRLFDYEGGRLDNLIFDGNPVVYTRLVKGSSITMPDIHIDAKAQTDNALSAIGPELYVNQNYGLMVNGTRMLKITAIQNQIFTGPTDYNELWSLITDDSGNYYFGIFYMQNSDQNHVILEHQVRLNDYQTISGRTFNAKWVGGPFAEYVKVALPKPVSDVKVDGFPFQTDDAGVAVVYVPTGATTIEVPNQITPAPNVRLRFVSWDNYGKQNPLNLTIDSSADLNAKYQAEYLLSLDSQYGNGKGAGWYAQGANATFSVPSILDSNNGTRRVFLRFTGDYDSASNTGWLLMDSAKHVTATWKTQFDVKIQSVGVPANSTVTLTLGGKEIHLNGLGASEFWADSGEQLIIQVQTASIQSANSNYNFQGLQVNGAASTPNIAVTRPTVIALVYSSQSKTPTVISLKANPTSAISGYPVTLTGTISGLNRPSNVTISVSNDKVNWQQVGNAIVVNGNSFSYIWTPSHSGSYFIRASWPGDLQHVASSDTTSVQVQDAIPTVPVSSNSLSALMQEFARQVSAVPLLVLPIDLARALLALGIFSADSLLPNAPPVLGYFLGSLLVGFVFVFPISAAVLSIKAARSRRSPSAVWLTPILTIWISTLFLVVTNGGFVAAPQALVVASGVLLIFSNALLAPLAFSLFLARVVAS
jgi:hypothetical protein